MADLSMKDYQHKGLDFDRKILTNMLSLWSPYLKLEDIEFIKARSNPSHSITVEYDFEPLHKIFDVTTDEEGMLLKHLGWSFRQFVAYYPAMENLNLFKAPYEARKILNFGIKDEELEWKEGHYYVGGASSPIVVYIDDIEEGERETIYTLYVLNLWATYKNFPLEVRNTIEGVCEPWFNVYKVPQRKLRSDYKLDITDWIDGAKKASFMNWNGNPL